MKRTTFAFTAAAVFALSALFVTDMSRPAAAQDFFSDLFGGDSGRSAPRMPSFPTLGYGADDTSQFPPRAAPAPRASASRQTAYCVRTCDGRHFPISGTSNSDRVANCNSFCPSTETQVYYGSSIDQSSTDRGKNYSSLPNAFKYRETLVAGCSCNGKDSVGLAHVTAQKDETVRKGDIVAGEDGLIVATRSAERNGRAANFSPAPASIRQRFAQNPSPAN
jgi:hypothetical protein